MDAAFISEENIYLDESLDKFVYKENGIYARSIEKIIDRNKKKKNLLNLLLSTQTVYQSVPYRVFYFSCNLEHVLHDKIQIEDNLKMEYAQRFQDRYFSDLEGFKNLICNGVFSVRMDYKDSWDFIKKDNNSIKRYINFNILLNDYLN